LISKLPEVILAGDEDMWEGLKVTIFYSLGTVPFFPALRHAIRSKCNRIPTNVFHSSTSTSESSVEILWV
jgi:hypothetical protein